MPLRPRPPSGRDGGTGGCAPRPSGGPAERSAAALQAPRSGRASSDLVTSGLGRPSPVRRVAPLAVASLTSAETRCAPRVLMRGPTIVAGSAGSPAASALTRSPYRGMNWSARLAWMMIRSVDMQICPEFMNAPSSRMISGFFPPAERHVELREHPRHPGLAGKWQVIAGFRRCAGYLRLPGPAWKRWRDDGRSAAAGVTRWAWPGRGWPVVTTWSPRWTAVDPVHVRPLSLEVRRLTPRCRSPELGDD
jgi:hypothetical protein